MVIATGQIVCPDAPIGIGDECADGPPQDLRPPGVGHDVGPNVNLGDVTYRTAFAGDVPEQGLQLPTGFATTIDLRDIVQSKLYEAQKRAGRMPVFDPDALGIRHADPWRQARS